MPNLRHANVSHDLTPLYMSAELLQDDLHVEEAVPQCAVLHHDRAVDGNGVVGAPSLILLLDRLEHAWVIKAGLLAITGEVPEEENDLGLLLFNGQYAFLALLSIFVPQAQSTS